MVALLCKLFGHKWGYDCMCLRCRKRREHKWEKIADKCEQKCLLCGKINSIPHKWEGCKCLVCGQIRDKEHKWVESQKDCFKICSVCGKREPISHQFQHIAGKCMEKCIVCGEEHQLEHDFENGICSKCNIGENDYYAQCAIKEYKQSTAIDFVSKITDPEMIKRVVLEKKNYYICLVSIDYIHDDDTLVSIAQDIKLDYKIRCKARNNILDDLKKQKIEIEEDPIYKAMYDMDIKSGM